MLIRIYGYRDPPVQYISALPEAIDCRGRRLCYISPFSLPSATSHNPLGTGLGWLLESWVPLERTLRFYLWAALSLYLSTMITYWALVAFGVDLSW